MIDDLASTSGVSDRHLRVLLAVVDGGSFTAAGRDLGIGQPAVSHAVRQLEGALGSPVFQRVNGRAVLTGAGRRLAEEVRSGLEAVDRAVRTFRLAGRDDDVELSVSMPLATYWLMPRLGAFRERHPDVELRISTGETDRLIGIDDADLWIPLGEGRWPELQESVFLPERIYPVAAPGHPLARPDTQPDELLDPDLLVHVVHPERHSSRYDWQRWFAHHGHQRVAGATGPRFNDYSVVLRAALAGQGIALGWHHLVQDLVADGLLRRVGSSEVETGRPLVVLARPASLGRPAVRALHDWLLEAAHGDRHRREP
ncbi:LysR substrate-binding domain-containing protein [Actinomycetospora termitidis]|uniref:LysR substrate-binding domain-containing protein n=1 Tax=Actinomycetospora termitidis TaxID=3053470 RepID=A0ABT7MIX9_9PSEU|nr:LysR substrate-binding domain-containing protein [Actinomycetospora sp. Odt1-22]MDL5160580.1 LysR substrate-binding domain-containing protein [Actinomycetospora sp. Odt1-22]